MWRMTNQLHITAKEVDEEKKQKAERAASRGSITSSADMKKQSSSINLDEDDGDNTGKDFQDFDYNTKRSKKASQVIMSINDDMEMGDNN